ncbi:NAD(+) kinase [Thiohalobacter thiocyanaticus]|uniref:NAD kinase n=1 Tax=Thiohalobacter thiocyanaticus TaxID=585455 RepID=A0A426QG61_9GAMM|nr:NAD(+) kinase [Thiohalobacter thiocyanaticus]RRQ20737.1 NAD(+) kinase [Thiohalobacter thiocyanaticus]
MHNEFTRIGLISKTGDPRVRDTLHRLIDYLRGREVEILLEADMRSRIDTAGLPLLERQALAEACDLAIVVGGDGTLLNAARVLAPAGVALIGINLGRLGFLTDVLPEGMTDQLDRILGGDYREESRTLLHASVLRDGRVVDESNALNDVVVHKWDIARMIELEVHIDGNLLSTQRADGLIVCTPTGSTAYALSGGGPILHPRLDAIGLVPICPHSLNNRPIVIDDAAVIDIALRDAATKAQVTSDGQVNFTLMPGDRVRVCRHEHRLRLIHPPEYDYFGILQRKFGWGVHS